jgi:hypothetical protein
MCKVFAWRLVMDSGFGELVYWLFFTITVDYNSSHLELFPNDVCLTNLYEKSLTVVCISDWSLVSQILDPYCLEFTTSLLLKLLGGPHRRHHVEQLIVLCCPVGCHGNIVFSNLLRGSESFIAAVVIWVSVDTGMRVYKTVVQQWSVPRCHENVFSEALPGKERLFWLYCSGSHALYHIIINYYYYYYYYICELGNFLISDLSLQLRP